MVEENIRVNIKNVNFNTIVFDLNGTITNSVSNNPIHILFRNEYIEEKIEMPLYGTLPNETTKVLELFMLDPKEYYKYRNSVIDWNIFHSYNEATFNMLSYLYKKGYNLVLYTDCYMGQIEPTLEILKIKSFFKLIVSRELGFKKPTTEAYRYIAETLDQSLDKILMIANDYAQDLKPLQDVGGNTIWIKSEQYLNKTQKIIEKYATYFERNEGVKNLEFT